MIINDYDKTYEIYSFGQKIKDLAKEGGVDLESKAKELGFNSFAEGVEAYNKQNNTSYSVDEAKEALGVK